MIVTTEGKQGGGGDQGGIEGGKGRGVGSSEVVLTCSVQQHIDLVELMLISVIKAGGR